MNIRDSSSIGYVAGLDGVRAIAVCWVMMFHFTAPFSAALSKLGAGWSSLASFAKIGWVGVDIFFVVSGFLIARILAARPIRGFEAYRAFLARRAWRLAPAYIACLVIVAAIAIVAAPDSKVLKNEYLLWTLTLNIAGSFGDRAPVTDAYFSMVHFWSLCVEWHFYLLFPLVVFARSPARAAVFLIALAIVSRLVLYRLGASDNALYAFTPCRLDSLAAGCLLASVVDCLERDRIRTWLAIAGGALFTAIAIAVSVSTVPFKQLPWMQTAGYSLIAAAVAMILASIVKAPRTSLPIRTLEHPLASAVGRASYSIYIWHLVFFPGVYRGAMAAFSDPRAQFGSAFLASLAITAIGGSLSYRLIESRFTTLRKRPHPSVLAIEGSR